MEITETLNHQDLLTPATEALLKSLSDYTFSFLKTSNPTQNEDRWECKINDNEVEIKAKGACESKEYLAHELLHVLMDSYGFADSKKIYVELFHEVEKIQYIFQVSQIGHINNILAHHKMLPIYLSYKFEDNKFISDFNEKIDTVELLNNIQKEFPKHGIPNEGITLFICQFFALKFPSNSLFITEYIGTLVEFRKIDSSLYDICDEIATEWEKTSDFSTNYSLFKLMSTNVQRWVTSKMHQN